MLKLSSRIWRTLTDTAYLFTIVPYILHHKYRTNKYAEFTDEKFGRITQRSGSRRCLQIHAVSVGEVVAAKPVIEEFSRQHPDWDLHITVSTATGREVAMKRYPDIPVTYFPLDLSRWVKRFLTRVRPAAVLLMELEIWPNFLSLCRDQNIPVVVVNGRITEKSAEQYRKYSWFPILKQMLRIPELWLAQNETYAGRFREIGVAPEKIRVLGSVKYDIIPTEPSTALQKKYRDFFRIPPATRIIMAGSTHSPEESIILEAFSKVSEESPDLMLVLIPRHPHRFDEVYNMACGYAPSVRFTELENRDIQPEPTTTPYRIVIVDKMGILSELYNAADIVFIGGSFIDHGGQNMLEPCGIGKPTLIGPSYYNFADSVELLKSVHGIEIVDRPEELGEKLLNLLSSPGETDRLATAGREILLKEKGCSARTIDLINSILQ